MKNQQIKNYEKLSDVEKANYQKWHGSHFCGFKEGHPKPIQIILSSDSGIGVTAEILCGCNDRKDITDYSRW